MKILCAIRLHKWETVYESGPRIVQECVKCGKLRSSMYDVSTGRPYWADGDWWRE